MKTDWEVMQRIQALESQLDEIKAMSINPAQQQLEVLTMHDIQLLRWVLEPSKEKGK